MKLTRATVEMTQGDLAVLINEQLPTGFHLRHLHLTASGAKGVLATPWITADFAVGSIAQNGSGQFRMRLLVNKWLPIPSVVVRKILASVTADAPAGVSAVGDTLLLDLAQLLTPSVSAASYDLILADGHISLSAEGITVQVEQLAPVSSP